MKKRLDASLQERHHVHSSLLACRNRVSKPLIFDELAGRGPVCDGCLRVWCHNGAAELGLPRQTISRMRSSQSFFAMSVVLAV